MKKIISGFAAIVITFSAMAQGKTEDAAKQSMQGHGHAKRQEMFEKLNITEDQKTKWTAIDEDFKKQMQDLKSQKMPEDQMKDKKKMLEKERKAKISAMLTADQKQEFKDIRKEQHGERKDMGERKDDRSKKIEEMKKELNLTPDQTAKVSALQATQKSKIGDIKNNASLSQDQRKEALKNVMQNSRKSMEEILTPEQLKQWKEKMKGHPHMNGENE